MASRILITGSRGMLGQDLVRALEKSGTLLLPTHAELDISDEEGLNAYFSKNQPTLVVNAAAFTSVDGAETDRVTAENANFRGPALLSLAAQDFKVPILHFSTDQVFDGKSKTQPLTENDIPNPQNWYSQTKLLGEREVLRYENALVVRVQWLYGAAKDRFTPLKNLRSFSPFSDQFGAPTWTRKIAELVPQMLAKKLCGLYHLSHDDSASWAEVFAFVKEKLGLAVRLQPRTTAEAQLPAARPLYCVMSNQKLAKALGVPGLGSWKEPLADFLAEARLK